MPIINSETLAQGNGSSLLKPGDTVSLFFVGILDDPIGSKPRFLRGDWLIHEIRRKNLSIIGYNSDMLIHSLLCLSLTLLGPKYV